jgi:N-acetylmuramoyl-L-alanine amidase
MAFYLRAALTVCIIAGQCAGVLSSASAAPRSVKEIRFRTESDRTRIVLDLSGEPRYSIKTAAGPFRIVVDLPNCRIAGDVRNIDVHDGLLDRIRVNNLKAGAQVVLDLPRRAEFTHFALKPDSGKPHRIVIDIAKAEAGGRIPERKPTAAPRASGGNRVVIIDPGHGGDAPGTISHSGIQEKTLNLKLAKMLKGEIEKHPGYRAILVRDGDYDVHWVRRVSFARERGGELFVSLHFNSNRSSKLRGLELYFLSLQASDDNAAAVAERENLLLEAGADSAGFNDDLKSILFDVSLANAIQQSSVLADEAAAVLRVDPPIPFRKVKQAPFIVLRGIAMPSILVEGGFLSNRKEAAIVSKESYLRWLAKSLAEGIVSFLEKHPTQADSTAGS